MTHANIKIDHDQLKIKDHWELLKIIDEDTKEFIKNYNISINNGYLEIGYGYIRIDSDFEDNFIHLCKQILNYKNINIYWISIEFDYEDDPIKRKIEINKQIGKINIFETDWHLVKTENF